MSLLPSNIFQENEEQDEIICGTSSRREVFRLSSLVFRLIGSKINLTAKLLFGFGKRLTTHTALLYRIRISIKFSGIPQSQIEQ